MILFQVLCMLAHDWNIIIPVKCTATMKKTINVMVVEDDEYFNMLLGNTLKNCTITDHKRRSYRFRFHSFLNADECVRRIRSLDLANDDLIAFVDYYLGDGINGTHIIKILKDLTFNCTSVLLSQSKGVKEKTYPGLYDYFILKDKSAPALCCLFLEQYLDNKIYLPLD